MLPDISLDAADTVIWVSGSTSGLGNALVQTVPFPNAKVISLSRRPHPQFLSLHLELSDPTSWTEVGRHFAAVLESFPGRRALFIHNAYNHFPGSFAGEGDPDDVAAEVLSNVTCSLVLGNLFLRAAQPAVAAGVDVGMVAMSSASARIPYAGVAGYCSSKAAVEQWVRTVRLERAHRGTGPWVVAVRPGFVDTPTARASLAESPTEFPSVTGVSAAFAAGAAIEATVAARAIWAALPPTGDDWLIAFGEAVGST